MRKGQARFILSIATVVATPVLALLMLRARSPSIAAATDDAWTVPPRVYGVTLIPMAPTQAAKWSQQPLASSEPHKWSLNSSHALKEIDEPPVTQP